MKHTILFFGIVKNYEKTSSIPIYEAFKTFKYFNFDVVPYEFIAIVDNLDKVFETIKSLYKRIAEKYNRRGRKKYFNLLMAPK